MTYTHTHKFTLQFELRSGREWPYQYRAALNQAGCNDAALEPRPQGRITLHFARPADSYDQATDAAVAAVRDAIPGATLLGVVRG